MSKKNHNPSVVEIYGLSFHSPLAVKLLIPPAEYAPIYVAHDWAGGNLRKNLDATVKAAKATTKMPVVLAGNLTVLQQFLREYEEVMPSCKVILFDFPGIIVPFEDPLIEWLDCDHQTGGAWQTSKIKTERFYQDMQLLRPLGAAGRDLIGRMKRFCPRDGRLNEIEAFAEKFAAGLPKDYRDLLTNSQEPSEEQEIELDWKSQTFKQLLSEVFRNFDDTSSRQQVLNLALSYELGRISKREFTLNCNKILGNKEHLKRLTVVLKKWMDDKRLGRALYLRYLDYLGNGERRGWQTIVNEGKVGVAEEDLLVLIAFQPKTTEVLEFYQEPLKLVESLDSDAVPPSKTKDYHPEPPDLKTLF